MPVVLMTQPKRWLLATAANATASQPTNLDLFQQILLAEPDAHVILEESMSKKTINGPLTLHGDNNWATSSSMDGELHHPGRGIGYHIRKRRRDARQRRPVVQNVLGVTGDLGLFMGLTRLVLSGNQTSRQLRRDL